MKTFIILLLLGSGICVKDFFGSYKGSFYKNHKVFLDVLKCVKKSLTNGVPEIGIPSHDPFRFSTNFSKEINLSNYSFWIALEDMFLEGIPQMKVTQLDERKVEGDILVFDYTIYWKKLSFEGTWRAALTEVDTQNEIVGGDGIFIIECHYCNFYGEFNFSKPGANGNAPRFNDLTFHLYTEETELHISNLGLVSNIISLFGGQYLKDFINLDFFATELGPWVKDMLNEEWLGKPETLKILLSKCNTRFFKKMYFQLQKTVS